MSSEALWSHQWFCSDSSWWDRARDDGKRRGSEGKGLRSGRSSQKALIPDKCERGSTGRATGMDVISLCLYYHDESIDMQYELHGSTFGLRWPWHEVKYWSDLLRSPWIWFDAPWREKHAGTRIKSLAFLVKKLFVKQHFWVKNRYFVF